jgi:hypothetical protein
MSIAWLFFLPLVGTTPAGASAVASAGEAGGDRTVGVPAVQDERPEIGQVVEALERTLGCDGKRDEEAVRLATSLAEHYPRSGPKDRASIARVLGRALNDPRKKPRGEEPARDRLPREAADALGGMGEHGARELERALAGNAVRANPALHEEALAAFGRTRAKRAIELLIDRAGERDLASLRGAARGLRCFGDAEPATRKRAFEALFRALITLADEARSSSEAGAWIAKDLFEGARADGYAALETLSGTREADIDAWQRWWNKNKQRAWEKSKP